MSNDHIMISNDNDQWLEKIDCTGLGCQSVSALLCIVVMSGRFGQKTGEARLGCLDLLYHVGLLDKNF